MANSSLHMELECFICVHIQIYICISTNCECVSKREREPYFVENGKYYCVASNFDHTHTHLIAQQNANQPPHTVTYKSIKFEMIICVLNA